MLSEILDALERSEGLLNLRQLSRVLGVEESALRGMLDYLVVRGYLKAECCDIGRGCEGCSLRCGSQYSPGFPDRESLVTGYTLTGKAVNRR